MGNTIVTSMLTAPTLMEASCVFANLATRETENSAIFLVSLINLICVM